MTRSILNPLCAVLMTFGLASSAFADQSALPAEPQEKSPAAESVQPQIEEKTVDRAAEKRKRIMADAVAAVNETEKALEALEANEPDQALAALEIATGKLELILARDPELALAPVDIHVVTYDLAASPDTVEAMIDDAEELLEDGEIQQARPLVANLASEVQFRTTSVPLATYPDAIKDIAPLIDEGKTKAARTALQAALNTLVVTTDEIIPLPTLRAGALLGEAETLAENEARTEEENERLAGLLDEARNQLRMADLLGYASEEALEPVRAQLDDIEDKTAGGKGGKGWFDTIKEQVTGLI